MTSIAELSHLKKTIFHNLLYTLFRGNRTDPAWERPTLLIILALNTALNFWNLSINGWGNYFYTAAVQSGTKDLTSAFFGSSDWGNSITVDKPPLSLWAMEISVRIFGFSPLSVLAPQAVMGVASTFLIYLIVRRQFPPLAALIAAGIFLTTPIIVLMSRYNNPDPLMILLMLLAVYLVQHAIASEKAKFFIWAAIALGLAFMTKQLQAMLVLPSLGIAFLFWFRASWPRKIRQSLAAMATLAVTGGIWMAVVDLVPPSLRPYVGGSPTNSVLELTLAYNGVDRVIQTEDDTAANLIPEQFRQVDSDAGFARLLNPNYGQEIGWLLVCGIICTIAILALWKFLPATRGARATAFLAISWFVGTYLVLSFMGDQIHTYYTAALAPSLSLVIGLTAGIYIDNRRKLVAVRLAAAVAVLAGSTSAWLLLNSIEECPLWLPTSVLATGAVGASMLASVAPNRTLQWVGSLAAAIALLAGPIATSLHNVSIPHNGSNPVSGQLSKNPGSVNRFLDEMQNGNHIWAYNIAFGQRPGAAVVNRLSLSEDCTWAAATYTSQTAARLQIETNRPIMPIGGFAGTDPSPTLQEFKDHVEDADICYFLGHDEFLATQTGPSAVVEISKWVTANFESEEVDGQRLYDLRRRSQ